LAVSERTGYGANPSGQQLEEDAAERIDVRASVDRLSHHLLGRDVVGRVHPAAGRAQARVRRRLARQAEVAEVDVVATVHRLDEYVPRLDVAVDESRVVSCLERAGDGAEDRGRPPRLERASRIIRARSGPFTSCIAR
jgi:hypothetical protein